MKREVAAAVVALAVWGRPLCAQPVEARHELATLSWIRLPGAEQCPSSREVASRVDAHLGRPAFVEPARAQLFVEAAIAPAEMATWRIGINLLDQSGLVFGRRELNVEAEACTDAADTAALTIALLLDPNALSSGSTRAPAETGQTPRAVATPVAPPSPRVVPRAAVSAPPPLLADKPAAATRTPWRIRLSLGALAALEPLPGVAFGAQLGVRLSPAHRRVGVDALGTLLTARSADLGVDAEGSFGGRFSAMAAGLGGWWSPWRSGRFSMSLSTGLHVGRVTAGGYGFDRNSSVESWLVNGFLDADLGWALTQHWGLLARPGLGLPFWRDRFEASRSGQSQQIFRASAVLVQVSLGLSLEP